MLGLVFQCFREIIGILQKATDAKEQTGVGQEKETIALAYNSVLAKKVSNGNSSAVTDSELNEELDSSEATASGNPIIVTFSKSGNAYEIDNNGIIKESISKDSNVKITVADAKLAGTIFTEDTNTLIDKDGNEVVVPKGFKISSDSGITVKDGIVIEDNDIQTYADESKSATGNQYVWIPVTKGTDGNNTTPYSTTGTLATGEEIKLSRYVFADGTDSYKDDIENILTAGTPIEKSDNPIPCTDDYDYVEDTADFSNTKALSINNFKNSVATNGGYYIGRYEASYGSDKKANSKISIGTPKTSGTISAEGMLWNLVKQSEAATASRNLYSTITSDLMNSYAWDTAIVYIQKCGGAGYTAYSQQRRLLSSLSNTGNLIDSTGNNYSDNPCNINDMAGNLREWTTETCTWSTSPCIHRGSFYNAGRQVTSSRGKLGNQKIMYNGFRVILYF